MNSEDLLKADVISSFLKANNEIEKKLKEMDLVKAKNEAKAMESQKKISRGLQKEVEEFEDLRKGIKLDMVLIPDGKFIMGSPSTEQGRSNDETQHDVTLTKPFYIGKYEVTQEQWEGIIGNNPSFTKGAKLPVTDVSWNDCQEFIKKLNAKTNGGYRLPTEAEWEYACRAGTTTAYSNDVNFNGSTTKAVGSYKPNAFGLCDMDWNVREWCEDWYEDYLAGPDTDPKGPAAGTNRVLRGGSFIGAQSLARSSSRSFSTPTLRNNIFGLRLARTINSADLSKLDIKGFLLKTKQGENEKANLMDLMKLKEDKDANTYKNRGDSNSNLNKYAEAIADYTKAIEMDSKFTVALNNRGNAYYNLNKYAEAIADYTKAIELDPKSAITYNNRGLANSNLKKYTEAITDYTKAIELNPKQTIAYNNRGNAYKALGKTKEAEADFAKSVRKAEQEKVDLGKGVMLEMLLISAGKFTMGSPASEKGRLNYEMQHEVTLTKPFYMGKYEVTQEQWETVMGNNPSTRKKGATLPVTDVSWNDCQEFVKKLNAKTNGGYRLPTEAEWEYACRARTTTAYSFGDNLTKSDANYGDAAGSSTKEIGSYNSNAFGLYDMHGNVFEWCEDWFDNYPAGSIMDPVGPATGEYRVLRGGSFVSYESDVRSSYRIKGTPSLRGSSDGFRLARTP